MCRWFAYVSPSEPCLLSDVLISPANSLSKQCSKHYLPGILPHGQEKNLQDSPDKLVRLRNMELNMDGLGIVWYSKTKANYAKAVEGLRPVVYKSTRTPANDFNLRVLCENTESHCVFAHIRASTGGSLAEINCHPFVFGRHAFMHNGVIDHFINIKIALLEMLDEDTHRQVHGVTDSELAAALYITNLTKGKGEKSWESKHSVEEMIQAMVTTVIQIMEAQKQILGENRLPNSLNFCATDGKKLVALRFRNSIKSDPPSLYWSEFAGRTLNQKYPGHPDGAGIVNKNAIKSEEDKIGKHTIIASEPTTYDEKEWKLIGRNCAFTVDEKGNEKEIEISYDHERLDSANEPSWPV